MQPGKIRWNRLAILIVGVSGVLLLCCIGAAAVAPNLRRIVQAPLWKTDAQWAARAARQMADYELPPDYLETKVLSVQGRDYAVIMAHRERPGDMIYMETVTEGIIGNDEWRARYETRLAQEMGAGRYNTKTTGTQQMTIRGQPVAVRILEGVDEKGRKVRQAVCAFSGKSGDVLLGIVAGQETWDQAMVERFLQSIH